MQRSASYSSVCKLSWENSCDEEDCTSAVPSPKNITDSNHIVHRPGGMKHPSHVQFFASWVLLGAPAEHLVGIKKLHLSFKFMRTDCKLVRNIFACHGFREAHPDSASFNLMWTGCHLKPIEIRSLLKFQKVNHFPRSYELTRKDRLYKNIQKMQHIKGFHQFDFIPSSYLLPSELNDFYNAFLREKGPWIVKPCASSRGRGIYLINNSNQIPLDETVLVCKYIENPLLVNEYKFDCRIYVAVTSFDPLRIYIFREGLARFSTVKYQKNVESLSNPWMHLTNYSINKASDTYVRCDDPEVDNYGSKWSLSAMLRHLQHTGKDTKLLLARIEDVIIKTILSGEMLMATALKMFAPFRGNCFELFGFDILVDENLKPWLLEVNLSPSLACDSPLDLKIKVNLVCDLLNLAGVTAEDPGALKSGCNALERSSRKKSLSMAASFTELKTMAIEGKSKMADGLSKEEKQFVRETKDEFKRKGGFIRIYPSLESWELYGTLHEHQTSTNRLLHCKLYPHLWRSPAQRPASATYIARARSFSSSRPIPLERCNVLSPDIAALTFFSRCQLFMEKLEGWGAKRDGYPNPRQEEQAHLGLAEENLELRKQTSRSHVKNCQANVASAGEDLQQAQRKLSLKEVIGMGCSLSRLQAREAFAVYLQRLQCRLLQEISHYASSDENTAACDSHQEEQINLIQRFLKKAAANLSAPVAVNTSLKHSSTLERKKNLARELNEFVRVYTRETQLLCGIGDGMVAQSSDSEISSDVFQAFLALSSESELEEILTVYTRHNKSASIFLGAKSSPGTRLRTPMNEQRRKGDSANDGSSPKGGESSRPTDQKVSLRSKSLERGIKKNAVNLIENERSSLPRTTSAQANRAHTRSHLHAEPNHDSCHPHAPVFLQGRPQSSNILHTRQVSAHVSCAALADRPSTSPMRRRTLSYDRAYKASHSDQSISSMKSSYQGSDTAQLSKVLLRAASIHAQRTYSSSSSSVKWHSASSCYSNVLHDASGPRTESSVLHKSDDESDVSPRTSDVRTDSESLAFVRKSALSSESSHSAAALRNSSNLSPGLVDDPPPSWDTRLVPRPPSQARKPPLKLSLAPRRMDRMCKR